MKKAFLVFGLLVFCCLIRVSPAAPAVSGKLDLKALDDAVNQILKAEQIPGLALSIAFPDGKQINRCYGKADLENQAPVGENSVFEIGSVSKLFTALAVMKLKEEGKLKVTDSLTKYFPQYPNWSGITIKNLLQHTSGIPDLTGLEPIKSNQMEDRTPQESLATIGNAPLEFEPGQRAKYSNSGAILLGLIIEKASGVPFADYLRQVITQPLGQTTTRSGSNLALIPGRVSGYHLEGSSLQNAPYASLVMPYASGGMVSSAADLVKLEKALTPGVLLKAETLNEMFAPCRLNDGSVGMISPQVSFGYCLELVKFEPQNFTPTKNGEISGFNAVYCRFADPRVSVALASNRDGSTNALYKIAIKICRMLK